MILLSLFQTYVTKVAFRQLQQDYLTRTKNVNDITVQMLLAHMTVGMLVV